MKYKLIKEDNITVCGHTLYRIKAIRSFDRVEANELGGYIEKEDNLSQYDTCWISGNAKVFGNARVSDNAMVYDDAMVFGKAKIFGNAYIFGDARVCGTAMIFGSTNIYGKAKIFGNAEIFGNINIYDNAIVCGDAEICDNADIFGNAIVCNDTKVFGNTLVCDNAYLNNSNDYVTIGPIGSRSDYTTFYLDKDRNIYVKCGCFNGTIDEFESAVKTTHKNNKLYRTQYLHAISYASSVFKEV